MQSTGVARKVDQLGRVVLPVELRRALGIREGDRVEIALDGARVVLTKLEDRCVFCGTTAELREFAAKLVCATCVERLTSPSG